MKRLLLMYFSLMLFGSSNSQTIAYHPNLNWHISGTTITNANVYPFHYFSPQYGFPSRLVNGKWEAKEWDTWKKENNFSYAYPLVGHSWQGVILHNKDAFQQHPEYLAEVKGKRLGYGKTTKFCVSNKDLQALFIKDRIAEFEKLNNPDGAVSVEPSDGGGFCECDNCKRLGSISNQVFMLANLTAKALRQKYANGKVNLYAYYTHSKIPDFDLESNVHVTVIPEGFQKIYDSDEMLAVWAKKAKIKTYYEYFAIPQQRGELPRLYMQNFLRRMQLAKKLGYQGYWFETGLNINTAIALQLFNQLWLEPEQNWNDVTEKFLHSCFPNSYQPMKRLFTRWWHTWIPDEEIPMAIQDLKEASRLNAAGDERERINDLKAYVHYIILYQNWTKNKSNQQTSSAFFDYIYNSSIRLIVNAPALYQLFTKYLSKEQITRYNFRKKDALAWIEPLTSAEIEQNFNDDMQQYGTATSNYQYVEMSKGLQNAIKTGKPIQDFNYEATKLADNIFFFGKGALHLRLKNPKDIKTQDDNALKLTILNSDGAIIADQLISYNNPELNLQLPKGDIYRLSLLQYFSTTLSLQGEIIPILTGAQMKKYSNYPQQKREQKIEPRKQDKVQAFYYITK